jgi:hypothetical protein
MAKTLSSYIELASHKVLNILMGNIHYIFSKCGDKLDCKKGVTGVTTIDVQDLFICDDV